MAELQPLINFLGKLGPFGLLCVVMYAVWSGRLVLKREFDRERERAEKAEAALDASMPVLQRAIEALNRAPEVTTTAVEAAAEVVKQKAGARK